MNKKPTGRVKPSQRMKKRYILFYGHREVPFSTVRGLVKKLCTPNTRLIEFEPKKKRGIVRCQRGEEALLRKALASAGLLPVKTSGSLKKLRQEQADAKRL
jgi:RNase P/RNase MRP subunit POP5